MTWKVAKNVTAVVGTTRFALVVGDSIDADLERRLGPGKITSLAQVHAIVPEHEFDKLFAPESAVPSDTIDVGDGLQVEVNGPTWLATPIEELGLAKKLTQELAIRGKTVGELLQYGEKHGTLGFNEANEAKIREAIEALATRSEQPPGAQQDADQSAAGDGTTSETK
jgi:hypothetical protein